LSTGFSNISASAAVTNGIVSVQELLDVISAGNDLSQRRLRKRASRNTMLEINTADATK